MNPDFAPCSWSFPPGARGGSMEFEREESALAALRAEASQGHACRTLYDLYQEMEDKDGHLYAVLQTRKNGVLARERRLLPAEDSRAARDTATCVQRLLDDIPDFESALGALLDALAKGFAVVEILWHPRPDGSPSIAALRGRPQSAFAFAVDRSLRILIGPGCPASPRPDDPIPLLPPPGGLGWFGHPRRVPPGKFLVLSFGSPHANPYGKGLCLKAYWYYWFKKHNLKFWAIYNERFGAPAVVGKYAPGTSEEERRRLLEVMDALQSDSGVTLPEHVSLEFLEARRSGDGKTYRDFADWCNDEISKIVLGATLVASEGRRSGSLALGEVHQRVRSEYVEADAKLLMECIQRGLIAPLTRLHAGPDAPVPRWVIATEPDSDPRAEAEVDRALVNLGVPLPLSHFYEHYRRPIPRPGEKTLRFDDNNLYQYHLQFGVLTINEVRASLGLPPVPWGDVPPRAALRPAQPAPLAADPVRGLPSDPREITGDPPVEESDGGR